MGLPDSTGMGKAGKEAGLLDRSVIIPVGDRVGCIVTSSGTSQKATEMGIWQSEEQVGPDIKISESSSEGWYLRP